MKTLELKSRGRSIHNLVIGFCRVVCCFVVPAAIGQTVYELEDYTERLAAMNVPAVHENYTGSGATLVHMEGETIFWDALDTERVPVFGKCEVPASVSSDATGWSPAGDACQISWLMCFKVGWGGQRSPKCAFGADRTHATNVAKAMSKVAPGARIVSIKIDGTDGRAYALAAEWLTTPSSNTAWYLSHNFSVEEAAYYKNYFGGESPARFWNAVAINGSFHQVGMAIGDDWDEKGIIVGIFSDSCAVYNDTDEFRPEKYVADWWAAHNPGKKQFLSYEGFDAGSALLQKYGIMPIFAAHNFLWRRKSTDADGKAKTVKFVTQNGVAFPACLAETFAASGIAANYAEVSGRIKYIGSNAHPRLTDFLAAGSGASSFSAPMVAGAVAVLRSESLMPDAKIEDIVRYLAATRQNDAGQIENLAEVGFSCDPTTRVPKDRDIFPGGPDSYWQEHRSLNCNGGDPVPVPYKTPYTKVVIDLGAATALAETDRDKNISH